MASSREKLLAASKKNYQEQKQSTEQPTLVTGVVEQLNTMDQKEPFLSAIPVPQEEPVVKPVLNEIPEKPVAKPVLNETPERPVVNENSYLRQNDFIEANGNTKGSATISFDKKKKETRSVRKCFLITPSLNKKLVALAKSMDVSENDILNDILKQVFDNM